MREEGGRARDGLEEFARFANDSRLQLSSQPALLLARDAYAVPSEHCAHGASRAPVPALRQQS